MAQSKNIRRQDNDIIIAESAWGLAIEGDFQGALKILKRRNNLVSTGRFYEIQSSICSSADPEYKHIKTTRLFAESVLSRILNDIDNPRLYLDIGDFFWLWVMLRWPKNPFKKRPIDFLL